jgi:formamidopyrimidine-DNA glycosylase
MPELPEVEIARRNLARWLHGAKVVAAEADKSRVFRGADPSRFEAVRGGLERAERKGKYLLLAFEGGQGLLCHLGMTGKFLRRPRGGQAPFSRARLLLDEGPVIHFCDPRLFGRIEPAPAETLWELPAIRALGHDPLTEGLTPAQLQAAVGPSKQALKVALMDQGRIAGLGNIHAAEALYRAGLHPARKPGSLDATEWRRLAKAIGEAIRFALEQEDEEEIAYVEEPGAPNPFLIYGRKGQKCRKCKSTVRAFTQGGRTTHYCPGCQPKTKRRSR